MGLSKMLIFSFHCKRAHIHYEYMSNYNNHFTVKIQRGLTNSVVAGHCCSEKEISFKQKLGGILFKLIFKMGMMNN